MDYILSPNKAHSRKNRIFADFCQLYVTFFGRIYRVQAFGKEVNS